MHLSPKECAQSQSGNIIVSPLSVWTALTLLFEAANGNTYEELQQGLHLSNDKATIATEYLAYFELLQKNAGTSIFSMANQIYIQQSYQLNANFQLVAEKYFQSGIESLNFANTIESATIINQFVENKTNGLIEDLVSPDMLSSDTRCFLVNAIYFKGNWKIPFNENDTCKNDFYNSHTEKVSVDFMTTTNRFNYVYTAGDAYASALEMKYANSNFSFLIFLPHESECLATVENKLKNSNLSEIVESMRPTQVAVTIPKFEAEFEIELSAVLTNVRTVKQ